MDDTRETDGSTAKTTLAPLDPDRQTGRTTGLMLEVLGQAIAAPNFWIPFVDHRRSMKRDMENHRLRLQSIIRRLGFTIDVALDQKGVTVRFPLERLKRRASAGSNSNGE